MYSNEELKRKENYNKIIEGIKNNELTPEEILEGMKGDKLTDEEEKRYHFRGLYWTNYTPEFYNKEDRLSSVFMSLDNNLKNDPNFVLEYIKLHPDIIYDTELKKNPDFMMKAAKISGYILRAGDENIQNNISIVKEAIRHSGGLAFRYASRELREREDMLIEALDAYVKSGGNLDEEFLVDTRIC